MLNIITASLFTKPPSISVDYLVLAGGGGGGKFYGGGGGKEI